MSVWGVQIGLGGLTKSKIKEDMKLEKGGDVKVDLEGATVGIKIIKIYRTKFSNINKILHFKMMVYYLVATSLKITGLGHRSMAECLVSMCKVLDLIHYKTLKKMHYQHFDTCM